MSFKIYQQNSSDTLESYFVKRFLDRDQELWLVYQDYECKKPIVCTKHNYLQMAQLKNTLYPKPVCLACLSDEALELQLDDGILKVDEVKDT